MRTAVGTLALVHAGVGYRTAKLTPEELNEARVDARTLRRAWAFARPYHGRIALYLLVIAAASLVAVLPPLVFKRLIDVAIPRRDLGLVNRLVAAAVGLALAETGLRVLNRWFAARIGEGLIFDLRTALYDHVQRMPLAFFGRTRTGALISRLSNDVVGAQGTVATLATVTSDLLLLTTTLGAMLLLSWEVTLFALLVVPGVVAVDRMLSPQLVRLSRRRLQLNGEMGAAMTERFSVGGAMLVKLFGRRQAEHEAFAHRAGAVRDSEVRLALARRAYYAALTMLGAVGTAGVYLVGSRSVIDGSLEVGGLVALAAYVARLYSPLTDLAGARVDLLAALVSFERCFEVLDAPHPLTEMAGARSLPEAAGRVELDDVWFRYPAGASSSVASLEGEGEPASDQPSDWVLRGVSLVAEPGTMTALVGPSGAGKTTLSSLVPRLYDVTAGAVRIDGHDVRELTLASLSTVVGVVTQDPHLFHDSIAANLRYARPGATDEELLEACRAARLHEVVAALPAGLDTVVGERGYRMSGGEKQRLAIARMLLKDPAVVILDEATAHLDSETEALVQQALAEALAGRTSIVIAHRLSTIRVADQILVIDGGRIVERGRHGELLAAGGLFAELHETQYAEAGGPTAEAAS